MYNLFFIKHHTSPTNWPWIGKLFLKGNESFSSLFLCTVVLLDVNWVICPAHCLVKSEFLMQHNKIKNENTLYPLHGEFTIKHDNEIL